MSAQDKSTGKPNQLSNSRWFRSVEQAFSQAMERLDCVPDCPLFDEALDLDYNGDVAGALAVLDRHRTHQCQWARSPWL